MAGAFERDYGRLFWRGEDGVELRAHQMDRVLVVSEPTTSMAMGTLAIAFTTASIPSPPNTTPLSSVVATTARTTLP